MTGTRLLTLAALLGGLLASSQAEALTAVPLPLDTGSAPLVQVYGGCGPMGHRGPFGGCRPGGQWGGYRFGAACPRGFHLGPYGRRCWPNRY